MIYVVAWYFVLSIFTFAVYGVDKRKARLAHWRVKEATLHSLELLGGWPGGLLAQRVFHHKSRKTSFQVVFWTIVVLHLAVWTYLICRYFSSS